MGSSVNFLELVTLTLLTLSLFRLRACYASPSMQQHCHDEEKSALLHFRESLAIDESASKDPLAYPKTASWKAGGESGDDCCTWHGVECNKDSGHVVGLDLSSSCLYGSIDSNSSLFHLFELRWLNLTDNNFNHSEIPSGIRNLSRLSHLDLSYSSFFGQIPSEILELSKLVSLDLSLNSLKLQKPGLKDLVGNLTNLQQLKLTGVNISSKVPQTMANLSSLSTLVLEDCGLNGEFPIEIFQLPSLRFLSILHNPYVNGYLPEFQWDSQLEMLKIAGTSFSGQLPETIGNLKSLSEFDVWECHFSGLIPSSLGNLTKLNYLDLSSNNFSSGTLHWLCNLVNLTYLDLEQTNTYGNIPSCFRNLTQLTYLDLLNNTITGQLPSWIGNLTQLTDLILSDNKLHGPIPESISRLQNLENLDLAFNFFSGTFKFDLLHGLKNLSWIQLTDNSLSLVYNHNATSALPKFQLLGLSGCNSLGEFPSFLHGQNNLEFLALGNNKIEGKIPKWFMNLSTKTLWYLNLKGNLLTGFEQPFDVLSWNNLRYLFLSGNNLEGLIPIPSSAVYDYRVSDNKLIGDIPPMICSLTYLLVLDLSNNNLGGQIPQCLGTLSNSASVLVLRNNSFSGDIPQTFSSGCALRAVDFSQNRLEGLIPRSLANCTKLEILNLEQNKINDIFPSWLGVLPELRVLILRSNVFHGGMGNPETNIEFPKLQIVDLSNNSFRGKLPFEYFRNWTSMKGLHKENLVYMEANTSFGISGYTWTNGYDYTMTMTNKGVMILYEKIQDSLVAIDLSSNMFEEGVPEVIGDLKALNFLNLSNNFLIGPIPLSLGNLKDLESLDLSKNKLSGEIPMQLEQLTFLAVFNVSHNFLSGPIPRGKQFDTFDNSSYDANSGLCGMPLSRKCGNGEDSVPPAPSTFEEHEESGSLFGFGWKVVAIGYASGFVIGGIIGCFKDTRKYQWFVKSAFARRQQKVPRARRRRSGA